MHYRRVGTLDATLVAHDTSRSTAAELSVIVAEARTAAVESGGGMASAFDSSGSTGTRVAAPPLNVRWRGGNGAVIAPPTKRAWLVEGRAGLW